MEQSYFDEWLGTQLGARGQKTESDLDARHWALDTAKVVKDFEDKEQDRMR